MISATRFGAFNLSGFIRGKTQIVTDKRNNRTYSFRDYQIKPGPKAELLNRWGDPIAVVPVRLHGQDYIADCLDVVGSQG